MFDTGQLVWFIDIFRHVDLTEARMYYGRIISQSFINECEEELKVYYNIAVEYTCFGRRYESKIFEDVEELYVFYDEKLAKEFRNELNDNFKKQKEKLKNIKLNLLMSNINLKDKNLKEGLKYLLDNDMIEVRCG